MSQASARAVMIGVGGMSHGHIRKMLKLKTEIVVTCDPSPPMVEKAAAVFKEMGVTPPPNEPDFERALHDYAGRIDCAFIITPHAYHHLQAKACLEAGLDVLLEKPMVMNAAEALNLIETRDRTGKQLVVAFQGSLSPQVREASRMIGSGELGELLSISGTVWQNWRIPTLNTWRADPILSGGGFLFDTGAHMLNTVSDLAGQDFVEVAAWLDNRGEKVDIMGVIMGRLRSGSLVTMNACGDTSVQIDSEIRVVCARGLIRTGQWGERLELQREGDTALKPVPVTDSLGVWEQFLKVRNGQIKNPSPPEIGLRMARLWDAIRTSAENNGVVVKMER